MKKSAKQNINLGIFVIFSLLIFTLAVYYIGSRQSLFGNTARVSSVFKDVNGLQQGNNVRFAGVNIGTVRAINIINDTAICVDMVVNEESLYLIKKNSLATINSDGLVGSMIVNIIPGEGNGMESIRAGDTIASISKIATADMLTTLNTTNENAALLTADLLKITNAINAGEGVLGKLLKDDQMAANMQESFKNLQASTQNANLTIARLNNILGEIDLKHGVAGVLLNDTVTAGRVVNMVNNLENTSKTIDSLTGGLNSYSEKLVNGKGTLNFIATDTTFVKSLEATVENAEQAAGKLNENMEALKHNFLFRGYFRKLEKLKQRELKNAAN
ncbi:MCE family protein [Antarcticibacterium flavum]|uniref:MCE family protein n=1 Tax=Antarcticibacterium flavum TaxID=2058175 RepID=A0A5B7WZE6_9FLAO|nr:MULTISPECIES: MlaD family protein [Antarcticibacterium]MCM4158703.1 MCE family protein [Antarcticibacterium sp. W02-3]QCY68556.1 MCE family protein [Antarcticibacterium flavum]